MVKVPEVNAAAEDTLHSADPSKTYFDLFSFIGLLREILYVHSMIFKERSPVKATCYMA